MNSIQPNVYPSLEELLRGEDPERLLEVRRSIRSILSPMIFFFLSALVVVVLNVFFYDAKAPDLPVLRHLSVRWLAIIPLGIFLEIVRRYNDDLYVLGRERVTHHDGRLSLAYKMPSIRCGHIRAVTVNQDIVGRMCDFGDVELGTAAHAGSEVTIRGVLAPYELAGLISGLRDLDRQNTAAAGTATQSMSSVRND